MAFSNFIPEVWSARLLEHLDKVHVYANLMNRDYEGEIRAFGDTVHINQVGAITISDYTGADLSTPEELDSTMQDLAIDKAKYFNFQIKDVDNAQSNPKLVDAAMQRASYGMNDVIDQYLASLLVSGVDAGNILADDSKAVTPTSATAYDYLVDLSVKLDEANVNQAILQGGLVGEAAGFQIHLSNNVPNTSGSKYKVLAGTNAAGAFAEQLVELEAYRLEKNFSDAVKGLHVYGAKVVQPKSLALLTCNKG